MNRLLVGAMALALGAIPATAQSLEDLNIQIHGYATQGFFYTTQNNIFSTNSSNGSPAWTEAVVNLTSQPTPKLRVGVQARYFLLGDYGNTISLDWAQGDYKFNEKLGVRFGKVKTPEGLFNEVQDIDTAYIWSILPQGIYPLATRTSILTHLGGVVYGNIKLSAKAGSIDYRAWDGERIIASDDPLLASFTSKGFGFPNGANGNIFGGTLRWKTPVHGLMLGASETGNNQGGPATLETFTGTTSTNTFQIPFYFGQYEHKRITVDYEYMRLPPHYTFIFTNGPTIKVPLDFRNWYGMGSYKVSEKLTMGTYFSSSINQLGAPGSSRYQKDWAVSGRYDVSSYLYLKAEQHFLNGLGGIADAYSNTNNTIVHPQTKLTILKVGVSF